MTIDKRIENLEKRLSELEEEKSSLEKELKYLKTSVSKKKIKKKIKTPEEKIKLFLELFVCRKDVYARYWENKNKRGYSPVCANEWRSGICEKPKIKCNECKNQSFECLDEKVIQHHLEGKIIVGNYSITKEDKCKYLVADFDKKDWWEDIIAYQQSAEEIGIEVLIEISRSGNGGHGWIFFADYIEASLARKMGKIILTRALEKRHEISLSSYDRFFPNQDKCPSGGFGNLIALPLQKISRKLGRTIFVDKDFVAIEDQWSYLERCSKIPEKVVTNIVEKENNKLMNEEENNEILFTNRKRNVFLSPVDIKEYEYKGNIEIIFRNNLEIKITELSSRVITNLKRTAILANPEFFKRQRMRLSTWNTPSYIFCGKVKEEHLFLPRGNEEEVKNIIKKIGATISLKDKRNCLSKLEINFKGKLKREQRKAIKEILKSNCGVLESPTGSGKTVMACKIIAERKCRTLVLVHRKQLIEQWLGELSEFLNIGNKEIGIIGGGKNKSSGKIDIAMLQTLVKYNDFIGLSKKYEQVIVDECHHIPALSFENVLNHLPVRYCLGLTATPYRKDGLEKIIFMQCGGIKYQLKEDILGLTKKVVIRKTNLKSSESKNLLLHEFWDLLIKDKDRTSLMIEDIRRSLNIGKYPLIISERKEHLSEMYSLLLKSNKRIKGFLLTGGVGKKKLREDLLEINDLVKKKKQFYILSTGSFIGEGFNLSCLDNLFLTMPISFKGRLIQYAGRLYREHEEKKEIIIYDYVDDQFGLTMSMFKKRLRIYKKMNYEIESELDNDRIL